MSKRIDAIKCKPIFRKEKDDLRKTNVELMERLRQIWNNYKENVPLAGSRQYTRRQSVSSDTGSLDLYDDSINDKVNISSNLLIVCFFVFTIFRTEMNQLHSNVEKLSNKIINRDNSLRTEKNYNANQDFAQKEGIFSERYTFEFSNLVKL